MKLEAGTASLALGHLTFGREPHTALAHPAGMLAGNTHDQRVVRHVPGDHRSGSHKGKLADGYAADNG